MTDEERTTSTEGPQTAPGSHDDHQRLLIGLAARMEDFLEAVGTRLALMLDECEQVAAERAGLFRQASDFRQERTEWEKQRQKDIAKIRDECEQLAEAWSRLEEAERDRLIGTNNRPAAAPVSNEPRPRTETAPNRNPAPQPADAGGGPTIVEEQVTAARAPQPAAELSPVSILMQFQQLKRDIRNHAQRKN